MERALSGAVDELLRLDPDTMSDAALHDAVIAIVREESRLAAARSKLLDAWKVRGVWADDGSRASWARLAREGGLSPTTAKRHLHRAERLASMPQTSDSLASGTLSEDQADLIVHANQAGIEEYFARDESMLVEQAADLLYRQAQVALRYWTETAHEHAGTRQRDPGFDRHTWVARTFDGTVDVRALLDPVGGTAFVEEHRRLEQLLFERDLADARATYGNDVGLAHLARTPGQRAADALVEMAKRSRLVSDTAPLPRPLISVLCGYEAFSHTCEIAGGTVVAPHQLIPLLAEADIERIVFDGLSRVIDVGRRERFFTGALRRAIEVRDRYCRHTSGCDTVAEDCEIDHVVEYAKGGLTTQANGRAYCKPHNLLRNRVNELDGECREDDDNGPAPPDPA